jgi:hypothetical protein
MNEIFCDATAHVLRGYITQPCIDYVVQASAAYTVGQSEVIRYEMAEPRAFAA